MMLRLNNIQKEYGTKENTIVALHIDDFKINDGDFISIIGPSGSGKSTFLNMIGLADEPNEGTIYYDNISTTDMKYYEKSKYRREEVGYIFQSFNLIQHLTAVENVMLPSIPYEKSKPLKERASLLLSKFGMEKRANHYPSQLSGGEQQRVAIARSLINSPKLIIGDEPTGNLDTANRDEVIKILQDINAQGVTIVIATHDMEVADKTKRKVFLRDGKIYKEEGL